MPSSGGNADIIWNAVCDPVFGFTVATQGKAVATTFCSSVDADYRDRGSHCVLGKLQTLHYPFGI